MRGRVGLGGMTQEEEVKELLVKSSGSAEEDDQEYKNLHHLTILASKDREFLLSPTGAQVSFPSLLILLHRKKVCFPYFYSSTS